MVWEEITDDAKFKEKLDGTEIGEITDAYPLKKITGEEAEKLIESARSMREDYGKIAEVYDTYLKPIHGHSFKEGLERYAYVGDMEKLMGANWGGLTTWILRDGKLQQVFFINEPVMEDAKKDEKMMGYLLIALVHEMNHIYRNARNRRIVHIMDLDEQKRYRLNEPDYVSMIEEISSSGVHRLAQLVAEQPDEERLKEIVNNRIQRYEKAKQSENERYRLLNSAYLVGEMLGVHFYREGKIKEGFEQLTGFCADSLQDYTNLQLGDQYREAISVIQDIMNNRQQQDGTLLCENS